MKNKIGLVAPEYSPACGVDWLTQTNAALIKILGCNVDQNGVLVPVKEIPSLDPIKEPPILPDRPLDETGNGTGTGNGTSQTTEPNKVMQWVKDNPLIVAGGALALLLLFKKKSR